MNQTMPISLVFAIAKAHTPDLFIIPCNRL